MREIENVAVIGGDARFAVLASGLAAEGYRVTAVGFPGDLLPSGAVGCSSPALAAGAADAVVFPFPITTDGTAVFAPFAEAAIPLADAFAALGPETRVFGGVTGRLPSRYSARVENLLEREELLIPNAALTAEGALQYMMEQTPFAVRGSRVLITGFGRVGQALARVLVPLGADVSVAARKASAIALAEVCGCRGVPFERLPHIGHYDVIFNTVPERVFTRFLLSRIDKETLLLDLASKPGGVDTQAARERGIKTVAALSLPGKVAPKTAGEIIKSTLLTAFSEGRGE